MDNGIEVSAWHFLREDKRLGYDDNRIVNLGEKLTVWPFKIELCEYGFHGSVKILDALKYLVWKKAIICRVKLSGRVLHGRDKICASERTVISWCDADEILHRFACRVAMDILPLYEIKYPEDKRPRKAIETKLAWLDSKATVDELIKAEEAAAYAIWGVDESVAKSVIRCATWAANIPANIAAKEAVKSTSSTIASWDKYNTWLEEMVTEMMGKKDE